MNRISIVSFVTALLTLSCVTNTPDIDTQSGANKLTISLPTTRTALGEKSGESYPLYWSEGDCIALNGIRSEAALISATNPSSAEFSFNATLSYPYLVTYPFVNGTSSESPIVAFAAEQNYVEKSTEAGILPMYGYATSGSAIHLNHLAALLRFPVVASEAGTTLSKIVITSSEADLAGEFVVNCTDGTLTPSDNLSRVVTYNLPANFTLFVILVIGILIGSTGIVLGRKTKEFLQHCYCTTRHIYHKQKHRQHKDKHKANNSKHIIKKASHNLAIAATRRHKTTGKEITKCKIKEY